jgi:hypothetical protein
LRTPTPIRRDDCLSYVKLYGAIGLELGVLGGAIKPPTRQSIVVASRERTKLGRTPSTIL